MTGTVATKSKTKAAAAKAVAKPVLALAAHATGVIAPPKEDSSAVKSARRVLQMLEYFAERRAPATVADVVEALGYPQSSTSVLLRSLADMRYLEYDRKERTYIPTLRITLLGSWIEDQLFSEVNLAKLVQTLHDSTGATVFLGMQYDIYAQYVHLVQSASSRRDWYIKRGSLRPICTTAIGKVLLSSKTDVEIVYLVRRINAGEPDPECRIKESDVLREVDDVRQQGYAYTENAVRKGTAMVAVRVPAPESQSRMALGIADTVARMRERRDEYLGMLKHVLKPCVT